MNAEDFMDVVETFLVLDSVRYAPEDEKQQRLERMRAEIIRYNIEEEVYGSLDSNNVPVNPESYIEPTSDGYPGLEAPLG